MCKSWFLPFTTIYISSEIRSHECPPEGAWHCLSIGRWADCNIIVNINIYQQKKPHPNMFLNDLSFLFLSPSHLPLPLSIVNMSFFIFSLLFIVRTGSVSDSVQRPSPLRTNSEDHGSIRTKDQSPNPDKAAGKKSSDSGEEADKNFILIWVR